MSVDPRLLTLLRCPLTGQPLADADGWLVTADGAHRYEVVDGIPCLVAPALAPTHAGYAPLLAENAARKDCEIDVDGFVSAMLVPTCGNLFHGVTVRGAYPIPDFPPEVPAGLTLEVGCNWGRWSIAGALAGHAMVGVDLHLESLRVAQALARRLTPDNPPLFVLADARRLPFADQAFDGAFSYSVVQHFSRENAAVLLGEIGRVLLAGGRSMVQMPNRRGLKALLTARRAPGAEFDVRYYDLADLQAMFAQAIGPTDWSVDCFLGLNVHARDWALVPAGRRWVVAAAELLRGVARIVPPLARTADSVFLASTKPPAPTASL